MSTSSFRDVATLARSARSIVRARRSLLGTSALLACVCAMPIAAHAGGVLPTGGTVASGAATIGGSAGNVTITQSTGRAIINWQGFSVGAGNSVTFDQPDARSATLNRVTGTATSQIAGQIVSNGAVYLINPNGIAITKSGNVQTGGGFIASTLDIHDADFNAGKLSFTGKGASAAVGNSGHITAGQGAYVALLGGSVSNSGTISVPLGSVGLGSGEQIGLDINGGHFMQVAIPTSAVTGDGPLIDMAGTITVTGGRAILSAASVKNAIRNIVNLSGTISADSAIGNAGSIELLGGDGGAVTASGTLSVRATGASGDGGKVETSGAAVDFSGLKVDTSAVGGKTGTWLVDPTDLTVDAAAAATISLNLATSNVTLATDGYTATGPGITSDGPGDIVINAPLAWLGANTLTLSSYHDIAINAAITASGGGLTLTANNSGYQPASAIGSSAAINVGTFVLNSGHWVQNAASLPGFSATSFTITNPNAASFLRVAGGDGSSANPYLLTDIYGLQGLRSYGLLDQNFALAGDIDATGTTSWNAGAGFSPIADNGPFTGSLDGRDHVVNGLTINLTGDSIALIARASGSISNIGLVGGSITGGSRVAALVGYQNAGGSVTNSYSSVAINSLNGDAGGLIADQFGSVTNSYASGAVDGKGDNVGGLVGIVEAGATLTGSHATGNVTVTGRAGGIGGLVGSSYGSIDNSYATGSVTGSGGTGQIGGLAGVVCSHANGCSGDNAAIASLTNSYATGDVSADNSTAGGLIGQAYNAIIGNAYATGKVSDTGNGQNFGGLIGATSSTTTITNVHATGDVSGGAEVGGLIGGASGSTAISQAYASGNVSASIASSGAYGGLVGRLGQDSGITQSYATGSVTHAFAGNAYGSSIGGLVGVANGYITYSYATGNVTGTNDTVGGLIGTDNNFSGIADTNNHATGNVVGNTLPDGYFNGAAIGGLIGSVGATETITASYATGDVSAIQHDGGGGAAGNDQAGGLIGVVGNVVLDLSKSFASGDVSVTGAISTIDGNGNLRNTVSNRVGGLIGYISAAHGTIDQVYASGNVTTDGQSSEIGGLIGGAYDGGNNGVISNAYATGSVTATGAYATNPINDQATNPGGPGSRQTIGGLIGVISGTFTVVNTYATGRVSGADDIGGLLGYDALSPGQGGFSASYWDSVSTGQPTSQSGVGLTTAQMQDPTAYRTTYSGWDFDTIWAPPSSGHYPQLYALTPVVHATAGDAGTTYGTAPTALGTYAGGPSRYVFGPANDTLAGFLAGSTTATTASNVGQYAITPYAAGTVTSTGGVVYRVVADGSGTLTINPAPITITNVSASLVGSTSKTYDGTTTAVLTPANYSLSGFMNGDGASVNQTAGTYASANAGTGILVTASLSPGNFDANSGTQLSNYVLPTTASGTIGAITPATLTVLYTADPSSRIYGNANPALTGSTSVTGLVGGDSQTAVTSGIATFTSAATTASGVGVYGVTGGGISSSSGNYTVNAVQAAGNAGALHLTPRSILVAADTASSVYGVTPPTLTYSVAATGADTGLVNGDTLSGALVTTGSATANAGQYAITQGTLGNPNYSLAYTGATLTITPASLAILYTATPTSSIYGNDITGLIGSETASGLVNGDTFAGVTGGSAVFSTVATSRSGIGRYAITGAGIVSTSGNYTIASAQAAANATALLISPRSISVAADPASGVYGSSPTLSYSVAAAGADTGLVNGDTLSGALASSGGTTPSVGQYAITQGSLGNPNYTLNYVGATLSITPASLAIVYTATPTTSIYGNDIAGLGGSASANGLVNGDTLAGVTSGSSIFSTPATSQSGVGSYAVFGSGLTLASGNYTATFAQAQANATALSIGQRNLIVTADPEQRDILAANPSLTYTVGGSGLVNGDTLTGSLATTAGLASPPGLYAITQGTLAASANYALAYVGADLTIVSPPRQSLNDFLAWLRDTPVHFAPLKGVCASGSVSSKLREHGSVSLTKTGCTS